MHHPFAWLRDFEQVPIENLLLTRANIILRGHVHAADIRALEALERRLTVFTAGATFESRTSANTYHFARLDLLRAQGDLITHRYVHAEQRWEVAASPKYWRLFDPATPSVSLIDSLALFPDADQPYRYYKALLVAGHITDVPRSVGGRYAFLSFQVHLPGEPNDLGHIIPAIRNLLHWRSSWQPRQWKEQLETVLSQLHAALDELAKIADIRTLLAERERFSEQTTQALCGITPQRQSGLVDNIAALLAARDFATAVDLIRRLRTADVIHNDEFPSLDEMEVMALIELHRLPDATERLNELLSRFPSHPVWLYLASTTCYAANQYAEAAMYMHRALDAHIDIDRARRLAILIAGRVGDQSLVQRVE
jgi:hypothetical protein